MIVISVVLMIAMVVAGEKGEWGSVAVGAVIVVLLLSMACAGGKVNRAYGNFVDYWDGGSRRRRPVRRRR